MVAMSRQQEGSENATQGSQASTAQQRPIVRMWTAAELARASHWWYIGIHDDSIYGPHQSQEMRAWYTQGYFPPHTRVAPVFSESDPSPSAGAFVRIDKLWQTLDGAFNAGMGVGAGSARARQAHQPPHTQFHQDAQGGAGGEAGSKLGSEIVEAAKWLPMRLSKEDRDILQVVEAALDVSEYTGVWLDPLPAGGVAAGACA